MATLVLGAVGTAVGGGLGGSFLGLSGAVIGRTVGATVGRVLDQAILGSGSEAVEHGKIDRLRLTGAAEGGVIPRVFGRSRVGGHVIWATRFRETRTTTESDSGGGKGAPKGPKVTEYSYSISLALALCEGEIQRVNRVWADGSEIARESIQMRVHNGSEEQLPDALIEAVQGRGRATAFRGTAYVVIENLQLERFGNRVPQMSFEVIRAAVAPGEVPSPAELIRGVALVPGTGEFALATTAVHRDHGGGKRDSINVNSAQEVSDFSVAIRDLKEELPNIRSASLVVSWFGDDLRCGECSIAPRVETKSTRSEPQSWKVDGLDRSSAKRVPLKDGRPVYGGTPSDLSVVEAIRHLKRSNIDVTFYPFILMEQMPGNGLPDPHGDSEQPTLPWRGRITTALAKGQPGTSDRTRAAEDEVARFFGTSSSGSRPWNYRRFILHYAQLCAQAGGVEAFCIGSEMRGLTRIRGAGDSFPAVEELRRLATDVRGFLPNAKISYAADWSEYFGYSDQESGNTYFHLDPLWADPAIDFIGIDNYMPLSDWRDEPEHADHAARSIYDLEYLKENIEGGEGFDWFYASSEARNEQDRSPIMDSAHGEPWVYRYKDLRSWWSSPHHDRIDGARRSAPTAWVPGSKPFRFIEYGCAAIDKGANQPNKFIDEKSSESSLPYFSSGRRDDVMQMQYLRAILDYWGTDAINPDADAYDGKMLDLDHSFAWAWDTRPWPAFPLLLDYWSDGVNYFRGHWLSGRSTNQPLASVIAEICVSSGVDKVDVSRVHGVVRGYTITDIQSARADLQPLLLTHSVDVFEKDGALTFSMRRHPEKRNLEAAMFVRTDEPVQTRQRSPEADMPRRALVHHVDAGGGFEARVGDASEPGGRQLPVTESELPLSLTRGEGHALAERVLAETNVVRDSLEIQLPQSRRDVRVGDVITLDDDPDTWRVDEVNDAEVRSVKAVRTELAIFEPNDFPEELGSAVRPLAPLPVDAIFLDLPLLRGEEVPHAPYVAVTARPWPSSVTVYSSFEDAGYSVNRRIDIPSLMGTTETVLRAARPGVWDRGPELLVRIPEASLASRSVKAVLAGGNAAAIGSGSLTGWEVFQFQQARLVGPNLWGLSLRLRGQRGTEWATSRDWSIGQTVVILDGAPIQIDQSSDAIGVERFFRIGPSNQSVDHPSHLSTSLVPRAVGLRPYAPAHLRARVTDGVGTISWVRRSRIDQVGWDRAEIQLGEAFERYLVQVIIEGDDVLLEEEIATTYWTLPDAVSALVRGGELVRIRVMQLSEAVGQGEPAEITLRGGGLPVQA